MFYSCLYPHVFIDMGLVFILSSTRSKNLKFDSSFGIEVEKDTGMNLARFSA